MKQYAKPKRITASGYIVQRSCEVGSVTAYGGSSDLKVQLLDGGSGGTVRYEFEVDSAASSPPFNFTHPLYFGTDLYVTMSGGDGNASVSVSLVEGQSASDI